MTTQRSFSGSKTRPKTTTSKVLCDDSGIGFLMLGHLVALAQIPQSFPLTFCRKKKKAKKSVSCLVMSDSLGPHGLQLVRLLCPWHSPGKNTGVGCHSLLQGIFPTQELNQRLLCLLHWIFYRLSPQGKPKPKGNSIQSPLLPLFVPNHTASLLWSPFLGCLDTHVTKYFHLKF